jgi:hypothetical protein
MRWWLPLVILGSFAAERPLDRARRRLDIFTRQFQLDRQNVGNAGRKNATRDEQRQGELPWLQPKPLSGW